MSLSTPANPAGPNVHRNGLPRLVLIGGFLGAGKTTLASRLGSYMNLNRGRAAFITNDAGAEMVDTHLLRARGFAVEQVEGGCFCGRFDALIEAAKNLAETCRPGVLAAEILGCCAHPLRQADGFAFAPFTVVVDPIRAARFFKLDSAASFSDAVNDLYRRQIEEADFIVLNKIDLAPASLAAALRERFKRDFPQARLIEVSARTGLGVEEWIDAAMTERAHDRPVSELPLGACAEAESRLGWLNCSVQLSAIKGFLANPILRHLAETIQRDLRALRVEIAHLKMAVLPEFDIGGVATLNLVRSDANPELGDELPEPIERGNLSLNLRAEAKPDLLHSTVTDGLTHLCAAFPGLFARLTHMEHFHPYHARPELAGA